jgi:NAD(P)-dependent dehydrogenase (short-subunit alcohol dehydrogenase family)
MKTSGSLIVVTGGASGLGLATAQYLREAGAEVGVIDRAGAGGWDGAFVQADVSHEDEMQHAFDTLSRSGKPLSAVVHCAASGQVGLCVGEGSTLTVDKFAKTLVINTLGTFIVFKIAADRMITQAPDSDGERGVLIGVSSIVATEGQIGTSSYAASKGGVDAMILPLTREFARFGIRVAAIAPGIFETPMFASGAGPRVDWLRSQVQFPARTGRPSEFAAMARHIIENSMLNGDTYRLDGACRVPPGTAQMWGAP